MLTRFERRKLRTRSKVIKKNLSCNPRVVVYRSNKNTYMQVVASDGLIVCSYSTLSFENEKKISGLEKAKLVGKKCSELCLEAGISKVVFDKGAYSYAGRVKALAEACREAGLKF